MVLAEGDEASASLALPSTSVKMSVPAKTRNVPVQCCKVKGFWKYRMENTRDMNFRRVSTRVTVRAVHSEVSLNTEPTHRYLKRVVKEGRVQVLYRWCCFGSG